MKEKIQLFFEKNQLNNLRNESLRLGSSIASIVRTAITEYFERQVAK